MLGYNRGVLFLHESEILFRPEVPDDCGVAKTNIPKAYRHRHCSPSAVKQAHSNASIRQRFYPHL